jgi:hypothetical protein
MSRNEFTQALPKELPKLLRMFIDCLGRGHGRAAEGGGLLIHHVRQSNQQKFRKRAHVPPNSINGLEGDFETESGGHDRPFANNLSGDQGHAEGGRFLGYVGDELFVNRLQPFLNGARALLAPGIIQTLPTTRRTRTRACCSSSQRPSDMLQDCASTPTARASRNSYR